MASCCGISLWDLFSAWLRGAPARIGSRRGNRFRLDHDNLFPCSCFKAHIWSGRVNLTSIKPAHHLPRWKKDAPPSMLCVASNGSACAVLEGIGQDFEYVDSAGEDLSDWLSSGDPLPPGIWIGTLAIEHYEMDTYYGREWDMDMDFVDVRAATDEEVINLAAGDLIWDPNKWMDNWEEVRGY